MSQSVKHIENLHFAPSKHPFWSLAGAIRDSHGALLAPKQPSKSTSWQDISATKPQKQKQRARCMENAKTL